MPILDVRLIADSAPPDLAQRIADAAAGVLGSPPRGTWVAIDLVPPARYAENGGAEPGVAPVFVRVLLRDGAAREGLADQVAALTRAIASCCGRPVDNVHVLYEPAAAGRLAFGGNLVSATPLATDST
jgi:phenylpyruvate tautomerase PptA (4-oxalocrotonate tautomerase family)